MGNDIQHKDTCKQANAELGDVPRRLRPRFSLPRAVTCPLQAAFHVSAIPGSLSGSCATILEVASDPCHGTLSADYLRLVWRSVRSADCRRRPGTPDSRRALQLVKEEHLPTRWTTSHIFKITRISVGPRLFGGAGKRKSLPGYTVISARPKAATTVALEIEAYGGFEIETCQLLQDGET